MTEYQIIITIPKAGNKRVPITLNLGSQEDYPEDFFKQEKNVSPIKQGIEQQTLRKVTDPLLKKLILDIIQNIKLGRRSITVELDLPSAMPNSTLTTDTSSPAVTFPTPPPTSRSVTPKPPKPKIPKPNFAQTPSPDPWSDNDNQSDNPEQDDSEPTIIFKPNSSTSQPSKSPSVSSVSLSSNPGDQVDNTESEETEEPSVSYETATNEPDF